MASTATVVKSNNDYGKGIGYERQTIVWAGGTTTGTVVPSAVSGIVEIYEKSVVNTANANAVKVVQSYDSTNDKDILTLTGTANDSFDVVVIGRVA